MMRTQADIDAEKAAYREAIAAVFRQKIEAAIKEAMDETGHTDAGLELADFVVRIKMDQMTRFGKYVTTATEWVRMHKA